MLPSESALPTTSDWDAVVLGGGPSGAAAATVLAQAGRKVLLLERALFPRFHIGESLLPSFNPLLKRLGVEDDLRARGFVEKLGATFLSACGARSSRISFTGAPGVEEPRTYHVVREEFDALLLDRAVEAGATVRTGHRVVDVDLKDFACTAHFETESGERGRARAAFLLDASGRAGVVARHLGLRRQDPVLKRRALYAHFSGVDRPAGVAAGDIRVVVRPDGGWALLIPLPGDRTSVGCVFEHDEEARRAGEAPAECLDRWLRETPAVASQLAGAERVGPARWESDFSYMTDAYVGTRWLLLGDAAAFLDPVFSSGVQLALAAGVDAAEAVDAALSASPRRATAELARYERRQRARYAVFRRLVVGFHRPAFRELLFRPDAWPQGARALASVLAGVDRPSILTRLRVCVFFIIVALHERLPPLRAALTRYQGADAESAPQ